jgi:uncharacterized membrane protein YeaQ/YmgE (transglycosylase-associated protein family)
MNDPQVGWIAAIIIGGVAGWLAEQFMKSQMGLLMNIVLGIVGAVIASWLFSMLGVSLGGGWLGYLIAGVKGHASSSLPDGQSDGRPEVQSPQRDHPGASQPYCIAK